MTRPVILCLCTGNYCRSPLAEGLLRREVRRRGDNNRVTVCSAGTSAYYEGQPPAPLILQVVSERGGDLEGYRPRRVTADDVAEAGLILAMAQEHASAIAARFPEALPRTMLLSQAVGVPAVGGPADVLDPRVQELGPLRACADIIEHYIVQGYTEIMRRVMRS